jgi:Ca2+/Na+ antiporter
MLYSTALWLLLILLGLIVVFYCICILCDEHLVPTIEVFIEQFKIPEEVAAVTLVAFGSACPEIVLNSIGAMENKSSLSLPACLGSGIIAFGLIPSLCLLCNENPTMELKTWPVFREVRTANNWGFS